jgi:hypothetical protein
LATWTPDALSSERRPLSGACWRIVESQERISTMKLVDTLAEQARLEEIIEASKPPVPPDCRNLHYLLSTPFRYGAPYPKGSRFRRAGMTPGVFYASRTPATAMAETAFHRLLFYADSPDTPWPDNPGEFTAFSTRYRTAAGLDLTVPPFDRDRARWAHPTAYEPCQVLADTARIAAVDLLRYQSARDRTPGGINIALLACRAFASKAPVERQAWHIHLGATGVRALCLSPEMRLGFDRDAFKNDPRIAGLRWERRRR